MKGSASRPTSAIRGTASAGSVRIAHSQRRRRWECTDVMIHLPVLRWGQPYTSIDVDEVVHFATGEPIAKISRANGGLIQRDARQAARARQVLTDIPIDELIERVGRAGELYMNGTLPIG